MPGEGLLSPPSGETVAGPGLGAALPTDGGEGAQRPEAPQKNGVLKIPRHTSYWGEILTLCAFALLAAIIAAPLWR